MEIDTVLREVSEDIVVVDTHTLDELVSRIMKKKMIGEHVAEDRKDLG